jgi:hypothetical protein
MLRFVIIIALGGLLLGCRSPAPQPPLSPPSPPSDDGPERDTLSADDDDVDPSADAGKPSQGK